MSPSPTRILVATLAAVFPLLAGAQKLPDDCSSAAAPKQPVEASILGTKFTPKAVKLRRGLRKDRRRGVRFLPILAQERGRNHRAARGRRDRHRAQGREDRGKVFRRLATKERPSSRWRRRANPRSKFRAGHSRPSGESRLGSHRASRVAAAGIRAAQRRHDSRATSICAWRRGRRRCSTRRRRRKKATPSACFRRGSKNSRPRASVGQAALRCATAASKSQTASVTSPSWLCRRGRRYAAQGWR